MLWYHRLPRISEIKYGSNRYMKGISPVVLRWDIAKTLLPELETKMSLYSILVYDPFPD
jgi:hypothetical protein